MRYNDIALNDKALLKGECRMARKAQKKYNYITKALQMPDGTRKFIRAKTQEELNEKILQAQILVKAGVDICSEETFGHFAQMWFDIYKRPYLREKSLDTIKYVLNHQILPVLGNCRLRDISPMQIQALMAGLSGKSNSLQSKVLIHLRSIFTVAIENGLIAKSPVSSMLKPKGKRTEEKIALTPKESALLLSRVKNIRARTFLLIALHTGMRRGEIIGLLWEDIDFEEKVIHVVHNAIIKEKVTTISDDLKTKAGRRDIPLSDELERWLYEQKSNTCSKYVFTMKDHKPMTQSSYKSMWRHIERELPDNHISAHILRHTYITRMFEAGLDIKEIQYLAGHSTVDMTLRLYTHYDQQSRKNKTAEKVRDALRASA